MITHLADHPAVHTISQTPSAGAGDHSITIVTHLSTTLVATREGSGCWSICTWDARDRLDGASEHIDDSDVTSEIAEWLDAQQPLRLDDDALDAEHPMVTSTLREHIETVLLDMGIRTPDEVRSRLSGDLWDDTDIPDLEYRIDAARGWRLSDEEKKYFFENESAILDDYGDYGDTISDLIQLALHAHYMRLAEDAYSDWHEEL